MSVIRPALKGRSGERLRVAVSSSQREFKMTEEAVNGVEGVEVVEGAEGGGDLADYLAPSTDEVDGKASPAKDSEKSKDGMSVQNDVNQACNNQSCTVTLSCFYVMSRCFAKR